MKWVWIAILFCFGNNAISQDAGHVVRLMSYNIRLDHSGDNEDNWHKRKSDLTRYLLTSKSDFIGMQEALGHQLEFVDQELRDYTYLGVGRDDGAMIGEYSPILYDSTRWKAIETNTFWLSATPNRVSKGWDAVCLRVCTYGLFANEMDDDTILVLNTHFDHVGKIARAESISLINDFINQFEDGLPIVLMGDFNFTSNDQNYKSLTSQLNDSYIVSKGEEKSDATYNGWKADELAKRRIDYILYNDKVSVKKYKVDHPKTRKNRQLSDHYPVYVEISI